MAACLIDGCDTGARTRDWCPMHYNRWQRTGDPLKTKTVPRGKSGPTLEARLVFVGWTVVESGCWEWSGRTNDDGYGWSTKPHPSGRSVSVLAHRNAYTAWVGQIPDGMLVRHSCDNPPCINPAHLLLGTDADNSADAVSRRRLANGERAASAKVTDAQVADIRARHAAGGITQTALAREYGLSTQHMSTLIHRTKRKTLTNPIH